MQHLLSIEWLKIKRYRTFWILTGLFAALLLLWNVGIGAGALKIGPGELNLLSQAYSFPYVWDNLGFWTSIFIIFQAILAIILTTNEYQYRTNRQNIIDGWSRLQFFHAKWLVALVLSAATTLFVLLLGLGLGAWNSGSFSGWTDHAETLLYVFVLSMNYISFGTLLAFFLKRSGIAIGMFLLYCIIIESLLSSLFTHKLDFKEISYLLPLQSSDDLLPFPILDVVKAMAQMGEGLPAGGLLIASCCWIAVYYFVGRYKMLRSDW